MNYYILWYGAYTRFLDIACKDYEYIEIEKEKDSIEFREELAKKYLRDMFFNQNYYHLFQDFRKNSFYEYKSLTKKEYEEKIYG